MIESGSLQLQARTVRAWDSRKQPSASGTVIGAVAVRATFLQSNVSTSSADVYVEMPADRESSKISLLLCYKIRQERYNAQCVLNYCNIELKNKSYALLYTTV